MPTRIVPFLVLMFAGVANAAEPVRPLETRFNDTVKPFLTTYCTTCHSGVRPAADLDLNRFATRVSGGDIVSECSLR